MKLVDTAIPDIKIIEPTVFSDQRGFFLESFRDDWFRAHCADLYFVQENHSSSKQGTLRGLHYQLESTQGKLLRVTIGEIFVVALDMRGNSNTLGQWIATELSALNKKQLWVPEGFALGFYVMSDIADFHYKCTDYYMPSSEIAIRHDDADLAIKWPFVENVETILSDKDRNGLAFKQAPTLPL